jgi:hypothetical protein
VPAPTVVIDAPAQDRASPLVATMVDACTHAIFVGRCVLVWETSDADQEQAPAVAIVSWGDGAHRTARVEVGLRPAERSRWLVRAIDFRPEDAPQERWRAVGLVIATLVGDALHAEPAPPAPPPAPPLPPPAPPPVPTPPPATSPSPIEHDRAWLDAEALLGPGLDGGEARRGGALRVAWAPLRAPVFATLAASYAGAPRDAHGVAVSWTTLAAGVGPIASLLRDAVRVDARLEVVAQRLDAAVVAPGSGATDDGSRWLPGARIGAEVAWMPVRIVGVVAGAEGTLLGGSTAVTSQGASVGHDAPQGLGFTAFLGLRTALP